MTRKKIIELMNFKKSFAEKLVHRDINFHVFEGECLGLLGGSGIGKSVLLRSLIGLEKPDSGKVIIENEDISLFNERELVNIRKKVAYAFQGGALFDSMNVFDNLAYPLREHSKMSEKEIAERVKDTLEEIHMPNTQDLFPADLSGGMQKRIGLARAIILGPKVILYDEPTAGLDPFNTKMIQEIISNLCKKNVTSILVTHDIPTAVAVCDRIIILADGVVQTEVNREQVLNKSNPIYKSFVDGEIK